MFLIFKRFVLPLSLLFGMSACGITEWFGETEAPPLPGERIAILAYERGLRPDPSIADVVEPEVTVMVPLRPVVWSRSESLLASPPALAVVMLKPIGSTTSMR